jgi:hypothetical protein
VGRGRGSSSAYRPNTPPPLHGTGASSTIQPLLLSRARSHVAAAAASWLPVAAGCGLLPGLIPGLCTAAHACACGCCRCALLCVGRWRLARVEGPLKGSAGQGGAAVHQEVNQAISKILQALWWVRHAHELCSRARQRNVHMRTDTHRGRQAGATAGEAVSLASSACRQCVPSLQLCPPMSRTGAACGTAGRITHAMLLTHAHAELTQAMRA